MDLMALEAQYQAYEEGENQAQSEAERLQELILINQGRIEFCEAMVAAAKFGLWMGTSGGIVFLCRALPIFSFAGVVGKFLAFSVLLSGALSAENERERQSYQRKFTAVAMGQIGAEWDSILAIGLAINDFLALYGLPLFIGAMLLIAGVIMLILRVTTANSEIHQGLIEG